MEGNVCVAQVDFALCKPLVYSRTHLLFRYRVMLCILLSASLFACKPVVEVNDNFIVVQLDFALCKPPVYLRTHLLLNLMIMFVWFSLTLQVLPARSFTHTCCSGKG